MLNHIKITLQSFRNRGGMHIFFSTILLRVIQFILGIIIIRLLTKEDYGNLSYALSITQLILPFSGAGLYISLLHFGAIQKSDDDKLKLFVHTIQRGFLYSLFIVIPVFLLSNYITWNMPGASIYLKIFSFYIISYYLFYSVMSFIRIKKQNKKYAISLVANSLLVFGLSILGVYLAQGKGYAWGFLTAPAITGIIILLIIKNKENQSFNLFKPIRNIPVNKAEYTKYGLFTGLGNIASHMAWQLDTIMIGAILAQSTLVATYRVASLIPFSLIFIPSVFMQTDFVYIAERYNDKKYLLNYYKKYVLIFVFIAAAILAIWYSLNSKIVTLFGPQYIDALPIINILMINVVSTFLFRVPLGNILAAVGKSKWNSYSAVALLVVNFALNFILIPKYNIYGAAYATVISISLSCVINMILFIVYLKQIDESKK